MDGVRKIGAQLSRVLQGIGARLRLTAEEVVSRARGLSRKGLVLIALGAAVSLYSGLKVVAVDQTTAPPSVWDTPGVTVGAVRQLSLPANSDTGVGTDHHFIQTYVRVKRCGAPVKVAVIATFDKPFAESIASGKERKTGVALIIADPREISNVKAWFIENTANVFDTIAYGTEAPGDFGEAVPPKSRFDDYHWHPLSVHVHAVPKFRDYLNEPHSGDVITVHPYRLRESSADANDQGPEAETGLSMLFEFNADWTTPHAYKSCYVLLPGLTGSGSVVNANEIGSLNVGLNNNSIGGAIGGTDEVDGAGFVDAAESVPPPDDARASLWRCVPPSHVTSKTVSTHEECEAVALFREPNDVGRQSQLTLILGTALGAGVSILAAGLGLVGRQLFFHEPAE